MGTFTNSEYPDEMPVCQGKKRSSDKNTICYENYNLTLLDIYNGLSQV